jgi:preprotein translocase subunit YajC
MKRVRPEARRPAREVQARGRTTQGGSSLRTRIGRGRGSGDDPLSVAYSSGQVCRSPPEVSGRPQQAVATKFNIDLDVAKLGKGTVEEGMSVATLLVMQAGGGIGGLGGFLLPLMLMFGIMYFLVILPQQRQRKKVQEMLSAVKNGDKVITTSGIYGTVNGIDGDTIILKIADNVKIRVARAAIGQVEASDDAK